MAQEIDYTHKLIEKDIRPSPQRVAIYEYVATHRTHPTVDTVYSALSAKFPTLSRTTVYNTLHLFSERSLIQAIKIEDDEIRYDADTQQHMHFKCTRCGNIFDIMDEKTPALYGTCGALLPEGFSLLHTEINLWGTCAGCTNH